MTKTVFGIFSETKNAEDAISELEEKEFAAKDISIIMKDRKEGEKLAHSTGANVAGSAVTGATTGGVIGGIAGLLIGIGAIAIPGIGPLLIAGPLAAALGLTGAAATTVSGAATGALAGGLLGALVGLGIPEEEARVYEDRIREGAILVAVPANSQNEGLVKSILRDCGAEQIKSVTHSTDKSLSDEALLRKRSHSNEYRYAGAKGGKVNTDDDLSEGDL